MDTKRLTLIIIFIALATALNIAGPKIPAPYAPGILYYELWEIPIVIAFLAVGPTSGVIIAVINTLILTVTFPGYSPIGPFYNLIAVLPMLLGIYIPYKIATRGCKTENLGNFLQKHVKVISISATGSGIALRVIVTTVMNYFALQLPYPFGISDPPKAALLFLPLSVLFNATVALYTIPIAIVVTIAVTSRFNLIKK
jgi:riboflavin transporter FmnP